MRSITQKEPHPEEPRQAASRRARRAAAPLPAPGVLHGGPGLLRRQRLSLLQQLDGDAVGRAHEGHVAVARRAVDGDAAVLEALAGGVDVVDEIGEVRSEEHTSELPSLMRISYA